MNLRITSVADEHLAYDIKNALESEYSGNPNWQFLVLKYVLKQMSGDETKWAIEATWQKPTRLPTSIMNAMMNETRMFVKGFLAGVKSRG